MNGEAEEILKSLLNGEVSGGPSLHDLLANVMPPDLCRIALTIMTATYHKTVRLEKKMYAKQDASAARWGKIRDGVIQGVILAVVIAGMKALGWI